MTSSTSAARARGRGELMVVGRREGRRVGDDDAHRQYSRTPACRGRWNLFHGNTLPPGRKAFLGEMVRLASSDRPGGRSACKKCPSGRSAISSDWSGHDRRRHRRRSARRSGRFPRRAELGRIVTELDHGLLRSAFTGQANAILLGPALRSVESPARDPEPVSLPPCAGPPPRARSHLEARAGGRNAVSCRPCVFAGATRPS